jgi:hypothetical protein
LPEAPWIGSRDLGDEWGFDASQPFTPDQARALRASTYHGHPLTFCWAYVFFGPPRPGDLTPLRTAMILDSDLTLVVIQHCRSEAGWTGHTPSYELGVQDGLWAVRNAIAAGVPANMAKRVSVGLDLEDFPTVGQGPFDHCTGWGQAVADGGFHPFLYDGFKCGLTPQQLWEIHTIDRYTSDMANRQIPNRGTCSLQGAQTTIAGVQLDPQHAHPDLLGGTLTGLTRRPVEVA